MIIKYNNNKLYHGTHDTMMAVVRKYASNGMMISNTYINTGTTVQVLSHFNITRDASKCCKRVPVIMVGHTVHDIFQQNLNSLFLSPP